MEEEIKKIVVEEPGISKEPAKIKKPGHFDVKYIIYFIAGVMEIFLLFRVVFKITGADATSSFVSFIYGVTNFFVAPYANFILEPGTLIAMAVYALLAWGIAKIIAIALGRHQDNK